MSATPKVRKAVIAAAGFGTRFLPQTKAMPKEMLPLVDKPIIQHIVEELVEAGIEDVIIVTGYHKRSIEDHFDETSAELKENLKHGGKNDLLEEVKHISSLANFVYIRQKGVVGNATPLMNAEHLVGNEPFIYAFADDVFDAQPSRFTQLVELYNHSASSVLAGKQLTQDSDYTKYGVIGGDMVDDQVMNVTDIVEKPGKDNAPSDIGSVGGYLFTPEIFTYLHKRQPLVPSGEEFMIQPAMKMMLEDGNKILAKKITGGEYYDTGNKLDYLKSVISFGLHDPEIKDGLADHIKRLMLQ